MDRAALVKKAEEKWQRDELVKRAESKFAAESHGDAVEPGESEKSGMLESAGTGLLNAAGAVGSAIDRFGGAPTRSAIGAIQDRANPVEAFMNQFGENPELAPTGKEIVKRAGVPDTALSSVLPSMYNETGEGWKLQRGGLLDPTASGAAGLAVDVAADPLNLVGVGEIGKGLKAAGGLVGKGGKAALKGASIFADAVTGTKAAEKTLAATGKAAEVTGKVLESGKNAITEILNPKIADDAQYLAGIAQKHGIPPEAVSVAHEFGPNSSVTRLQRTIGEGTLGEKYLEAHNAGIEATSQALDRSLTKSFGKPPPLKADAGAVLKDGIDAHMSRIFDDADITYKSAVKQFPGLAIDKEAISAVQSKAIGMKREAQRLLRTSADSVQKAQAKNLMEWSDLLLNAKGNYKEMSEIVQNVGRAAYGKTPVGQIPSDIKKLRELYDVGKESLIHSIRKVDKSAADRLIVNNAEIAEMLGDRSTLGKIISDAKSPEHLYTSLVERGSSEQIATLKKILPADQFNAMRAKYLTDHVKYLENGSVNFKATRNALNSAASKERLRYLFEPSELQDLGEILTFGERFGNPIMSTSGTGGSAGLRNFKDKIVGAVVDENTLEGLKARGRGKAAPSAPAAAAPPAAPAQGLPSGGRGLLRKRGPVERRLKAAQSVAPSTYNRPKAIGGDETEEK